MSASATGSTSQNGYKTEAKTKPNANAKTKSRAKSKATGRRRYGSGHPESCAHSSQIEPVGLTSKEPEGQKPDTNWHVTTDEPLLALAELEFHDLLDVLSSPRPSSAKIARSAKAEAIYRKLKQALAGFTSARERGRVTGDSQFDWSGTLGPELHPDLAFVSFERWARDRDVPKDDVWHVVPDLVVEILCSSEQTERLSDWLEAYFRSGVNRVWIVYPEPVKILDYDSLSFSRVLGRDDMIDGRTMLPGFQLPVKELLPQ